MIRWLVLASLLTASLGLPSNSAAQEVAPRQPGIGDVTTLYDHQDRPYATLSVLEIVEPFEEFIPATSAPEAGWHWVMVKVAIVSLVEYELYIPKADAEPLSSSRVGFELVDLDGFITPATGIARRQQSMGSEPDLTPLKLAPEESKEDMVFFKVVDNSKITLIKYNPNNPDFGFRPTVILDLRDALAEPCRPVAWIGSDGQTIGEFLVAGIVDPFLDYHVQAAPNRGRKYVAIALSFTNLTTGPISIRESSFRSVDQQGNMWIASRIQFKEALASATEPGFLTDDVASADTVTGFLVFELYTADLIGSLVFAEYGTTLQEIRLIDEGTIGVGSKYMLTPVPGAVPESVCS
jgi:hypothetical protein